MPTLLFKSSINLSNSATQPLTLVKAAALAAMFVHGFAFAADSKSDWVQYPPRAAVKLTEQIAKFKEIDDEKKEGEKGKFERIEKAENKAPEKDTQKESKTAKELEKPKALISEVVSWEKDHKTKNTLRKFINGNSEKITDVVEPIAGEPSYKGNLQMIPMSYADGVKTIITRKAKSEESEWARDHTTKTTIYKFSDGTQNIDIKSIPKKYSQPEFKDGLETITITYGDGTQKTEEYEAIDRKVSWSKDHLQQKITYIFEDGKTNSVVIDVPKEIGSPVYEGDKSKLLITYGDGFKEEVVTKAIDQKITWSADHLTRTTTYLFADGGSNSVDERVPRQESEPIYKGNVQTVYYTYGDGTKTALSRKAISENVVWSADHVTKTTEYIFADGSVNKVVSTAPVQVAKPIYEDDTQIITTSYADGAVVSVVNKAIDTEVSWSEDHFTKTTNYKFADGTSNAVVTFVPNQVSPPTYKQGVESIKKIYGDGTEKILTFPAISQKEVWSSDHESKVIVYKFADGTSYKEEVQTPKMYGQPTYQNDTEIIPVNYADGTVKTIKQKAIESQIVLSEDGATKVTRYIFADGTVNNVINKSGVQSQSASEKRTPSKEPLADASKPFKSEGKMEDKSQALMQSEQTVQARSILKGEAQKPVYLQGLEIVTVTTSDGKTHTATYKAVSKDETWSRDGKTKFTTYKFADGTTNVVSTDVIAQMSKMPKASTIQDDGELTSHSLDD